MSFQIPDDSLFHQYAEAYRRFTWKGVRVFSGKKVLPKIQTQDRGKPSNYFLFAITDLYTIMLYIPCMDD